MTRAVPVHTIIRYESKHLGFWKGWTPVGARRYRLFVNATHEEVTGETGHGRDWDHDWSCEVLDETGQWRITGRNEWATLEEALKVLEEYGTLFATYEGALAQSRRVAADELRHIAKRLAEARRTLETIDAAKPLELPPERIG